MKKLSADEVKALLKTMPAGKNGEVTFAKEIEELQSGEALAVAKDEWNKKTPLNCYLSGKFNKKGARVVKCRKTTDGFLIVKL